MNPLPVKKNLRILVIDDTPAIHQDFRKILSNDNRSAHPLDAAEVAVLGVADRSRQAKNFEIDSASQGQEGLAMVTAAVAAGRPYAVVFVDMRMPPGWDGIETIERLWQVEPDLQVVICTAYSDYSWDQIIDRLGESDGLLVLKKPFDMVEVLQLASALTEKWRLTRQARATTADLETIVQARSAELLATLSRLRESLAERDRTAEALRRSEEKFSRAFRLHPDAISIHRQRDGGCLEVNASFTTITGYTVGDTLNGAPLHRDWGFLINPEERARLSAGLAQHGEISGVQGSLQRKDGAVICCAVSARLLEIGGEACVLAIIRDLTVQKRLEEQLAQATKMNAVGLLAGGVAHDYNNVLTATLMQLELLLGRTDLAPDARNALQELKQMANRSASLTRQLLAFSRQQVMNKARIDLNEVLGNLFKMLRRVLDESIHLEFHCFPAPLWIEADVGMIEQVVTNLCVNARDAMMPRGGLLTIRTSALTLEENAVRPSPEAYPGQFVCLTVEDTGCGMDAETQLHVFEPFFTTKQAGKGTGLGLASVYGITRQHRGWLEVQSAVGRGSIFRVLLPAATGASGEIRSSTAPATRRGSETILLVEDEEAVRRTVSIALRRSGYNVHEAGDGKQAIELWTHRAGEIDLLFTDMVMPNGVTGLDLVEHFRRASPGIGAIITSGYSVELSKLGAPNRDSVGFLAKPFEFNALTGLVRKCLDARPPRP